VGAADIFQRITLESGFEIELAPWSADGTDLDDPPVTWSIERSQDRAAEGAWSVRLSLDNLNDQGKIWIEQAIGNLEPGRRYDVRMSFSLASADFGTINLWRIIAGASGTDPENAAQLIFQDETGNGAGSDVGFRWIEKSYQMEAVTSAEGTLWFAIGVWGTSEFSRAYYIDDVVIVLTRQ
jgi:hypothetical protein